MYYIVEVYYDGMQNVVTYIIKAKSETEACNKAYLERANILVDDEVNYPEFDLDKLTAVTVDDVNSEEPLTFADYESAKKYVEGGYGVCQK